MRHFGSFVVALFLFAFPAFAQQTAYVVDMDGKAIATLDLASGKTTSKTTLSFTPDRAILSPDGKSVLALYQGPGTTGFWVAEFRPKGPSKAAIITNGKLVGETDLGWGLAEASFSGDGRSAYVLTTGYESNKAPERKPAELIRLDVSSGQIAARLPFDAAAEAFATDAAGAVGIVYSPPYPKKKPTPLPARIAFVDLKSFTAAETIPVSGQVRRPVAVGDLLYVLDAGDRNAAGTLHVIDTKKRAVVTKIPLGPEAVVAGADRSGRTVVLSQAADKKSGRVMFVKGTEVASEYPGPAAPKFVASSLDGKRLYVAGYKDFSVIDLDAGKGSEAVELARGAFSILPTSDGSRAFVVSWDGDSCCRISAFDVGSMKRLTTFLGGSKGERFGQGLAAVALTAASYQAGKSVAQSSGSNTFYYSIYTPTTRGRARGPLAFGPGEKKVYMVDTQTNDVTIVDVATGERLRNLDAGAGLKEVIPLLEAGVIAAIGDSAVTLIDVNTDEVKTTMDLERNVVDAVLTPDEKRLVIFGKKRVIVLDAVTAKEIARAESFEQPVQVLFGK
jgi:DNA-binding beta-propeller fold protein YncE